MHPHPIFVMENHTFFVEIFSVDDKIKKIELTH